ncbi:MAG: plastocyanin/azurin family copper-binding protein [Haloarculaceae archaeon]
MDRRDFLRTAGGVAGGATAASAAAGTAAAQEGGGGTTRPEFPGYVDGAAGGEYSDERGNSEVTVEVGAGSNQVAFAPTKVWVDPGTTINFEWVSNGHNVLPNSQPEGAGWSGHDPLEDEGFSYSHTFETGGMYTYYCAPHEALGMVGAVAVGGDVPTVTTGGGGGEVDPEEMGVPFHPHYVGVATIVMMVVSLLFTFFLLKYGESPHASGGNN